jgi:hypothetical protein
MTVQTQDPGSNTEPRGTLRVLFLWMISGGGGVTIQIEIGNLIQGHPPPGPPHSSTYRPPAGSSTTTDSDVAGKSFPGDKAPARMRSLTLDPMARTLSGSNIKIQVASSMPLEFSKATWQVHINHCLVLHPIHGASQRTASSNDKTIALVDRV